MTAGNPIPPRIFLAGFMGAGKTETGKLLAERLARPFLDLDLLIEARSGRSISLIFSQSGEAAFRAIEREALGSVESLATAIVALGGGAFISTENREILARLGTTLWLDCPFDLCWERIKLQEHRPLATSYDDLSVLYESRRTAYALADLRVDASQSSQAIVDAILNMLGAMAGG